MIAALAMTASAEYRDDGAYIDVRASSDGGAQLLVGIDLWNTEAAQERFDAWNQQAKLDSAFYEGRAWVQDGVIDAPPALEKKTLGEALTQGAKNALAFPKKHPWWTLLLGLVATEATGTTDLLDRGGNGDGDRTHGHTIDSGGGDITFINGDGNQDDESVDESR